MINFQKLLRINCRYLRKISSDSCVTSSNRALIYKTLTNTYQMSSRFHGDNVIVPLTSYSTSTATHSDELVDAQVFEKVCSETLESLTEFFEELIESKEALKNADVSYSSGVLTVNLGTRFGTYVINRQSPNKQIWLSSPVSGPKRYDYVVNGEYWIYKHDMIPLHKLLQSEISDIIGEKIDFSKCLYAKV